MATTWLPALTLQLIKLFSKPPVVLLAIGFGSKHQWLEDLITRKFKYDLVITDDYNFYTSIPGVKFIPNGVVIPQEKPNKKWTNFTFLFIGRNEPRKGSKYLKQAFKQVEQRYPATRLRLFGPGFKLITKEQLEQELFKSHCLVLPSLREGHPLILFEAWAHRLPVIVTNVGSVAQFVNPKNGYLVPARDVDALVQAMVKAVNNNELAKMGEAGFDLVKNYTWDKTASAYANSLTSL
jgi:glycosyltransferase involved in cell wall biosynthesis